MKLSKIEAVGFHPFQGRPLFGHSVYAFRDMVKILSFHPFQGRPLFGRIVLMNSAMMPQPGFPSLSGKTSIRTGRTVTPCMECDYFVSIPFREDLYSDREVDRMERKSIIQGFHPFQGRPLFGLARSYYNGCERVYIVSIPFREDLYSDTTNS